jgi:hypothetical protein
MFKKVFINNKLSVFFVAILLINLLVGVGVLAKIDISLNQKIADIEEGQRPADLDIRLIKNSSCSECFDLTQVIDVIKKYNVNILSEEIIEYNSSEGQKLIADNNIKAVPFFVLEGELSKDPEVAKLLTQFGTVNEDNFVATNIPVPYFSLNTQEIFGKTNMIMLKDDTCAECYDVTAHKSIMENFGVYVVDEEILSIQTTKGRELMNKYNIDLLPTVILTGDVAAYNSLASIWSQVGSQEIDGAFILREGVKGMGIYKDLNTNQIIDPANTKQAKK